MRLIIEDRFCSGRMQERGADKVRIYFWLYLDNYRTNYYDVASYWKRTGLGIFRNRC